MRAALGAQSMGRLDAAMVYIERAEELLGELAYHHEVYTRIKEKDLAMKQAPSAGNTPSTSPPSSSNVVHAESGRIPSGDVAVSPLTTFRQKQEARKDEYIRLLPFVRTNLLNETAASFINNGVNTSGHSHNTNHYSGNQGNNSMSRNNNSSIANSNTRNPIASGSRGSTRSDNHPSSTTSSQPPPSSLSSQQPHRSNGHGT